MVARAPFLYSLNSELVESSRVVETTRTRIGIRHLQITQDGFFLNDQKLFLRGCNRHQEYPFIGRRPFRPREISATH